MHRRTGPARWAGNSATDQQVGDFDHLLRLLRESPDKMARSYEGRVSQQSFYRETLIKEQRFHILVEIAGGQWEEDGILDYIEYSGLPVKNSSEW